MLKKKPTKVIQDAYGIRVVDELHAIEINRKAIESLINSRSFQKNTDTNERLENLTPQRRAELMYQLGLLTGTMHSPDIFSYMIEVGVEKEAYALKKALREMALKLRSMAEVDGETDV